MKSCFVHDVESLIQTLSTHPELACTFSDGSTEEHLDRPELKIVWISGAPASTRA